MHLKYIDIIILHINKTENFDYNRKFIDSARFAAADFAQDVIWCVRPRRQSNRASSQRTQDEAVIQTQTQEPLRDIRVRRRRNSSSVCA